MLSSRFGVERALFGSHIENRPHTFRAAHAPAAIIEALRAAGAAAVLGGNLDALLSHRIGPRMTPSTPGRP